MEPIIYKATRSTPAVCFDAETNRLEISGESYPENAFEFYAPLIEWMKEYLAQLQTDMTLQLRLTYLNTSSTRSLLTLLDTLEDAYLAGKPVSIQWFCHQDDDRAYETAEEFKEDLTLPFEILPLDRSEEAFSE
jgi:hypothetical protein